MCERTSKSSLSSITIGCACTRRWAIDLLKSSSNRSRRRVRPNREAQRWCSLRTKSTAERFLKGYWGKDSNAVPFPRPLLLLGDAKPLLGKRKLCPNNLCHLRGSPQKDGNKMGTFAV